MFTFYLFLLFFGIPTVLNFPPINWTTFKNKPFVIQKQNGTLDSGGHHHDDQKDSNNYSHFANPYNHDDDELWVWDVRNITNEGEVTSKKPTKVEERPTSDGNQFDFIPYKLPRDDSFEWKLFQVDEKPVDIEDALAEIFSTKSGDTISEQRDLNDYSIDEHELKPNDRIWSLFAYSPVQSIGNAAFEWKMLQTTLHNKSDNVIFSPVLAKLDLTILSEITGIGTSAGEEWFKVLPDLASFSTNRNLYKQILGSLKKESKYYNVSAGIKIYLDHRFEPRTTFLNALHYHYQAELEKLNFQNTELSAWRINDWAEKLTAGYLKNIVRPEELRYTELLLVNVIYFDGQWTIPFPDKNTAQAPFSIKPNQQVPVLFMTQVQEFYYTESTTLNAKILRLPLKGFKYSMFLLLPNPETTLDNVLQQMDNESLMKLQWTMSPTKVKVSIPKFRIDHTAYLKEVLQLLGIKEVFTPNSYLIGLGGSGQRLQLSEIVQKTGLIMSEKGCTAYESTVLETERIDVRYGNIGDEFIANRPFAFFIEDETTGVLLYAGKVIDPVSY